MLGSLIVGWFLIALGIVGVVAGIVLSIIEAAQEAAKEGHTLGGPDPWDALVKLAAELLKIKTGVPVVLGIVAGAAGIAVLHYQWF